MALLDPALSSALQAIENQALVDAKAALAVLLNQLVAVFLLRLGVDRDDTGGDDGGRGSLDGPTAVVK